MQYSLWKGCTDSVATLSCEVRRQGYKNYLSHLCCAKTVRLNWMINPWIIYMNAHICVTKLFFYKSKGILGHLVSWHCMSAKNLRIENFWDWAFYVASLPRTTSLDERKGFSHFLHRCLHSIQIIINKVVA